MKFIFVITNLTGGGAEKIILTLADSLNQRGHDVAIIILENRIEHQVPAGVHIIKLRERLLRGWFGKRLLAWLLRRKVFSMPAADLIVSALPFANEVAIRAKLPRLWCRVDDTLGREVEITAELNQAKAQRRLKRYQKLFGHAQLIAISDGVIEDLRMNILAKGRIEKIHNPFNFAQIRAAAQANAPLPSEPYILHVGRYSQQKRQDILLDAWQIMGNDAPLLILMTHPNAKLEAMIQERGLIEKVQIVGFQTNPYPWMRQAEMLVLSSDHEGLSNVIIEGLACGTRVVSTDCPSGPREILVGKLANNLTPPGDSYKLAMKIKQILNVPRADQLTVDSALVPFDMTKIIDRWEELANESKN